MKTLEIVFGNSCYMSMKESMFQNNDILLFNLLFNIGDLSKISDNKINIPKELRREQGNYLCKKEICFFLFYLLFYLFSGTCYYSVAKVFQVLRK